MECECHRIDELLDLLRPVWEERQELSLAALIGQLAQEIHHQGELQTLNDDTLIFHLQSKKGPMPGIAMEYVPDFRSSILEARGFRLEEGQWVA